MLKRLRGTPIVRHDAEHGMVYAEHAPYEVLATRAIGFAEMQRLRRFARTWDLIGNSGRFARTTPLLWRSSSPFEGVMRFSDALHAKLGALHGIASVRLAHELFDHLVGDGCPRELAGAALLADARNDPSLRGAPFLREFADRDAPRATASPSARPSAARQARHRA